MNYMKGLPMSRKLRNIVLILFFVIFTFSFIKVAAIFIDYKKAQNLYGEVQDKYVVENTASDKENDSKAPSSAVSTDLAPTAPSEDAGAHSPSMAFPSNRPRFPLILTACSGKMQTPSGGSILRVSLQFHIR